MVLVSITQGTFISYTHAIHSAHIGKSVSCSQPPSTKSVLLSRLLLPNIVVYMVETVSHVTNAYYKKEDYFKMLF